MFDIAALANIGKALGWFLALGKSDTEHMRTEILELLLHTSQSVRTLVDLEQTLSELAKESFTKESFSPIYLQCTNAYTGGAAAEKARTHCSDIERDLRRINFVAAKTMRTEWGQWKQIDQSFAHLVGADVTFLDEFSTVLRKLDTEMTVINSLILQGDRDRAWEKYQALRKSIHSDLESLSDVIGQLRRADAHIRAVLT